LADRYGAFEALGDFSNASRLPNCPLIYKVILDFGDFALRGLATVSRSGGMIRGRRITRLRGERVLNLFMAVVLNTSHSFIHE
jgi:hypothetical protein